MRAWLIIYVRTRRDNINVNTIAPGVIDNGFHAAHTSAENMDRTRQPRKPCMSHIYL